MNSSIEIGQTDYEFALPLELLCQIFQHLQDSEPGGYSRETPELGEEHYEPVDMPGHSWRAAREVCRTWQQAIDGYQRLWTTIAVGSKAGAVEWVQRCIDRSGTLDLRLQFFAGQQMDEVCGVLLPVRGRIKAIEVFNARTIRALGDLQRLFDEPLDKLVELKIQFDWRGDVKGSQRFVLDEEIEILPENVPALGTLDLRGVYIDWDSGILKKLHTLSLWGWSVSSQTLDVHLDVSVEYFLDILKACKSLRRLSLMVADILSHIACAQDEIGIPIELTELEYFSLHVGIDQTDLPLFVKLLRFPKDCIMRLSSIAVPGFRCHADCLLSGSSATNVPLLLSADRAAWNGPMGFECVGPVSENRRQGYLILDIARATDDNAMLDAFCDYFRHTPLQTLFLRWPLRDPEQYRKVFRTFPNLQQLSVECGYQHQQTHDDVLVPLVEALMPRTVSEQVLPGLRNVQLVGQGVRLPQLHQRFDELVQYARMQIQQAA